MSAHPDPYQHADFYQDVPFKRLVAWVLDMAFTAALALPVILPLLLGFFLVVPLLLIPPVWVCVGFLYRWLTLTGGSATWGMRIMAIELRDSQGQRLSGAVAFWHTLGTALSFGIPLVQAGSIAMMALTEKGQGLTDMVLGTVMLNRAA